MLARPDQGLLHHVTHGTMPTLPTRRYPPESAIWMPWPSFGTWNATLRQDIERWHGHNWFAD